jgi:FkbM family methyltransferase
LIVSTKQGKFKIALLPNESIGRSLYCTGQYELDLVSDVMKFLRARPGFPARGEGTVIDVGANNGVISIGMLHAGEFARAIAIEPEPQNFSLLRNNVDMNGFADRYICLPYVVSHQKGDVEFELSDTNLGDHRVRVGARLVDAAERQHESARRVISVQAERLDNLLSGLPAAFLDQIALIWVDVQGYEGYVFMGAKNLISTNVPLVAEIWPYGIRRSGMMQEQFCDIAANTWTYYWVRRRGKFVRYPIRVLDALFEELGEDGGFENVVFTQ